MKRLSLSIIILSLLSIVYSFTISAYTNEDEYHQKYLALDWQKLGSQNASNRFYKLREEYLSNKYKFQDYGFTFLILGLAFFNITRKGKSTSSPSSKTKIALVGFGAALLTTGGYVGDLFLEFYRGSYPWWADSLGIPLMGVPLLALIFIGWASINLLAMNGQFQTAVNISFRQIKGSNYFYLLMLVVTALIVCLCAVDGFFWMVLPGVFWLYFYASLWAGRSAFYTLGKPDAASGEPT
jgi:hypothetical protein